MFRSRARSVAKGARPANPDVSATWPHAPRAAEKLGATEGLADDLPPMALKMGSPAAYLNGNSPPGQGDGGRPLAGLIGGAGSATMGRRRIRAGGVTQGVIRVLSLAAVLFVFWLLLSGHFTPFLVISGAVCGAC